ncbi:hypothetical protein HYS95_03855 [Candidatus Daviesbacteria bacterium]|nr:hypothetical protein [Candidatus Daviesbacteria bacterium]
MGLLIVLLVRLLIPLTILRWPFWGGVASLAADFLDFEILNYFYPQGFGGYQILDKLLDTYYLSFELYIIYQWTSMQAKKIGLGLFIYRMLGVILFVLTGLEKILFLFPNLFEMFFLFYAGYLHFLKKEPDLGKVWLRVFLAGLFIYKIALEFTLHVSDWTTLIRAGGQ